MKIFKIKSLSRNANYVLTLNAFFFFSGCCAIGQEKSEGDQTLSPYFFVQSDNPETDQMPLKSTGAEINISGVIADVTIKQVYKNEGINVLEAVYVFPASTKAAIYAMKMTIGEREINAVIQEKNHARQLYQEAKNQGKTASLLEQQRPNVFQMQVANILPGDNIVVEMKYTELIIPESAVYQFIFPTVVGPRYHNKTESESPEDTWVSNPYLQEGQSPNFSFDLKVSLNAGMPVTGIKSSTHDVSVNYINKTQAVIALNNSEIFQGNRDFILQYKLAGNQIQSGILLFEDRDENYFLAMIQPPRKVTAEMIPPREYIFIVDISGSMHGYPLDISKELMKSILQNLRSSDRFNVLLFAGSSEVLFPNSIDATPENIKKAVNLIDRQQGGGGTELLPALHKALAMKSSEETSRIIVIVTDGYVSVEKEAFDLISGNFGKANFFSFGIGTSVNRYLIEGMSHVGNGESFIITNPKEAVKTSEKFRKYITSPVLTNIRFDYSGFSAFDIQPSNYPDVFAEKPLIVVGKYKGTATGTIRVTGSAAGSTFSESFDLKNYKAVSANLALKYLWAREKIRLLDDYTKLGENQELKMEITNMGLKYNLLTNYTSFVAVDSEIRSDGKNITTVKQPLPLPEGVSNYAVGAASVGYHTKTTNYSMQAERKKELMSFDIEEEIDESSGTGSVFMVAEQMPVYPGGIREFNNCITGKFILPSGAQAPNQKVMIEFVVDTDGSLKNIKILTSVDKKIEAELLRVLKTCRNWTPGKQSGKTVKVKMIVPVVIK